MGLLDWLNRPYPLITDLKIKIRIFISLFFGVFIYIFLFVFQPFGIESYKVDKAIFILGFGIISFIIPLFNFISLPFIFKNFFRVSKWTIAKEIYFILINLVLIAISNYFYNKFYASQPPISNGLLEYLLFTVSIGIFPITFYVFFTEHFLRLKHEKSAKQLSSQLELKKELRSNKQICINTTLKNKQFRIDVERLLFIKSEDNYCNIFYLEDNLVKKELLRVSLKSILLQNNDLKNLIKCHRSYIVNRDKIHQIKGNARAYSIYFKDCDTFIPVSRSFDKSNLL